MKRHTSRTFRSTLFSALAVLPVLFLLSACDSSSGDNPTLDEVTPVDNKNATVELAQVPQGANASLVLVNVTNAVPGTTVEQINAQNTETGSVGKAGVYQREHFTYVNGSGTVTIIVTLTDPSGEALIKEVKTDIPGAAPGNLAP
jgi:hypothetical protein